MKHFFKTTIVATCVASVLAGCTSPMLSKATDDAVTSAPTANEIVKPLSIQPMVRGSSNQLEARADQHQKVKLVRRATAPWIGGSFMPTTIEDGLPAFFREIYDLNFDKGQVPLSTVAARLTKMTGVPVRIRPDVYPTTPTGAAQGGQGQGGKQNLQLMGSPPPLPGGTPGVLAGGGSGAFAQGKGMSSAGVPRSAISSDSAISVDGISMQWHGTLRDFLDNLTNTLALSWEYRDGAVVIMRLTTQTYTVAVNNGKQSFSSDSNGSTGGAGGGGTTQSSKASAGYSEQGDTDAFAGVIEAVKSIVASTPGSLVVSNGQIGSLVVTTSKETQAQVRDYLNAENKKFHQNVNVTFDIYSVQTSDSNSQGLNWNLVFQSLGQYGINVTSPQSIASLAAGGISYTKLGGDLNTSSAMLQALSQNGNAVQHKPVSLTTQNGKLKTQQNSETEGYIASTTPGPASSSGGSGSVGLNAATITTGDSYTIMPVVQTDNSVLLKYSFKISNLVSLTNFSSGSGSTIQTVQTPKTSSVSDGSDVILAPGEVMMITGLSRIVSSANSNRVGEDAPLIFGGSTNKSMTRQQFVVLLRATPM